jgi:hypothetical protein
MIQKHVLPSLDAIRKHSGGKRANAMDHITLCDYAGFIELAEKHATWSKERHGWKGDMSGRECLDCVRNGDMNAVAASDAFLEKLEGEVFVSKGWRVTDDVVGALPNIPAFLTGNPMNMRRRVRVTSQAAPLAVFADLTSSGGISAQDMQKRGAAIFALVRLLSNIRPVELWAMTGLSREQDNGAGYVAVRIETSPLDLARAGHVMSDPGVARGFGYHINNSHNGAGGGWPYNDVELQRKHGAEALARVVYPGSEVLFMPPVYLTDDAVKEPVKWIKTMLAQYGGNAVTDEAA